MESPLLYISLRSPFARRIRLVLEELGIPYRVKVENVFEPSVELLAVNPLGRVPVLVLGTGEPMVESWQILEYLKERHGWHSVFLFHGASEPRMRNLSGVAVGVMEHVVQAFLETMRGPAGQSSEWRRDAIEAAERGLAMLDREIRGPFVAGEQLCLADLDIGAAIAYSDLRLGPQTVDRFGNLRGLMNKLSERESFRKTVPPA